MKLISLTRGEFAMVDDADYELVSKYKWRITIGASRVKYATTRIGGRKTLMHRYILGITDPRIHLDHVNGNSLDNLRSNLRCCDISQNKMNQHRPCGTSPLKGVSWCKPHNLWQAQIKKKGENYHLGFYKFEVDAAWAYDLAARELFGEYACLNFPDVGEQGVVFPDDIPKETFLSARVMFES